MFLDSTVEVASFREPGTAYRCNLDRNQCTCPDWHKRRGGYAEADAQRLCKHLISVYGQLRNQPQGRNETGQQQLAICLRHKVGYPIDKLYCETSSGLMDLRLSENNPDWINVYHGEEAYGFNHVEGRWSYGNEPPHAEELVRFILGVGEDLPDDAIATAKRTRLDQWNWTIAGECQGIDMSCAINTRAKWQTVTLGDDQFQHHIQTDELRAMHPRLLHMTPAIRAWVRAEFERARNKQD
ncbi:SWIM zinc finger family protein [Pseudodesulfovibrio pelocollis]|uniref:SWIM zinc finger family protein n=1 Tax=Pseudodesulfovibrio pelocollis TaxID=3051432 RepID=UPI00255AF744|nr:SWIM zinc finger family protein [Pseudodesulfovibrio sp. SB368]